MPRPNAGLCRACLGGCHLTWHMGCYAAFHSAPLLLLVQGPGYVCLLPDTSALLPLIAWNLQGTPQPAQSRGLLTQSPKERSSKCHVGTGQGPEQAQRSLTASQCLTCCPAPRMEPCTPSAAGWAAPGQERRHGGKLTAGRRLQAGSGTGSGRHTDKAGLQGGRLIGVWWKTSY